jgi:hypothetical protein
MRKVSSFLLVLSITTCVLGGPAKKAEEVAAATTTQTVPIVEPTPAPPTSGPPAVVEVETEAAVLQQVTPDPKPPKPNNNRRVVTYDQRQEGEYNIRADLQNFVILVVPSTKSSGLSLLDILTRSAIRSQAKNALKKQQQQFAAVPIATEEVRADDQPTKATNAQVQFDQFIEGRTPYKVDISSTATQKVNRFSPETRSVEILPYQPFNGRSAMLNLRPPAYDTQPGGFIFPPPPQQQGNTYSSFAPSDLFRQTKSLAESDLAESNHNNFQINSLTDGDGDTSDGVDSFDYVPNVAYLDLTDTENSFDSLNVGNIDRIVSDPAKYYGEDDELKLIGAEEQCGPDRKRDSYGVCQFIENSDI